MHKFIFYVLFSFIFTSCLYKENDKGTIPDIESEECDKIQVDILYGSCSYFVYNEKYIEYEFDFIYKFSKYPNNDIRQITHS